MVASDGTVLARTTLGLLSLHPDDRVLRLAHPLDDLPFDVGGIAGDDVHLHGQGGIWLLGR